MVTRLLIALILIGSVLLTGCNSTETVLQPGSGDTASTNGTASDRDAFAATAKMRLQLAPLVGAPVDKVAVMTKRLALRVRENDLALVNPDNTNATHVLKGYFSAFSEGQETTVVYVWDVLDLSGNRLHRFQGQEKSQSAPGFQNWDAVSDQTMEMIADRTSEAIAQWASAS